MGTDLSTTSESGLRYDVLLGDIEFRIGDADFSARWGWVPLLDFVVGLVMIARDLRRSQHEVFDFTESGAELRFHLMDDMVEIRSNYADAIARVSIDEFTENVRAFAEDALQDFVRAYPSLLSNIAFEKLTLEVVSKTN